MHASLLEYWLSIMELVFAAGISTWMAGKQRGRQ
jgi:hypothetical protein